jgi:PKD repeat protein
VSRYRALCAFGAAVLAVVGVQLFGPGPAGAVNTQQDRPVNAVPGTNTPQIIDGRVYAITQVGSTTLVGGSFTQVQPFNGSTTYNLPYVVAFDATTGAINTAFAPGLDGEVQALLPGPTAGTVYVGGAFNTTNGVKAKGLVLLDVSNGSRVAGFPSIAMNGVVQSVKSSGSRLFVAGTFTSFAGQPRGGLASLNATTGVLDSFLTSTVTVNHNWTPTNGASKAAVGVNKIDITPDGSRLVGIGNFKLVDGLPRDQVAMWDLTGATAVVRADWQTHRYEPACFYWAYDSYVRDVDISPDGSYFVIASTGGGNTTLCDTAARFEINGTGTDIQPTWVDYTGGDTLLSVAITGTVVYVGGHQRWLNNPAASDRAGGGSVPRPGLAALDPGNGMPLTWNPGRNPRGAGAYALYASPTGLYVGSDTGWIGNFDYHRERIAFFPLAGGVPVASKAIAALPAGIYFGSPQATGGPALVERNYDGSSVGPVNAVSSPLDFRTVRAATLVGGTLYYGKSDGLFYRRTFDGSTFGAEQLVDPYNDPYWSTVDTGSGQTFRGLRPSFYSEIANLTSLFFDGKGTLYYTVSGQSSLFARAFSPDSGVVHNTRATVAGGTLPNAAAAFLSGGNVYYVTGTTGTLSRIGLVNGALSGAPTVVSGPAVDGVDWRARALFTGSQVLANVPPTAQASVTCSGLDCTASAAGSTDPDGSIGAYSWTWGDGATSTGVTAAHTYAAAGTYSVGLTVTDNRGGTGSTSQSVTVAPPAASPIAFRGVAGVNTNSSKPTVTVPGTVQAGDALALLVSTKSGVSSTAPAGWTALGTSAGSATTTTVWQKVAGATDAGSAVTVTLTELTKVDVRLLAYSGTAATNPVTATITSDPADTVSHPAPAAAVPIAGSWVVRSWSDKSAGTTTSWTAPAGVTTRSTAYGTGTVFMSSLVVDSAGSVGTGTVPAATATTNAASRGDGVTLVIAPAG